MPISKVGDKLETLNTKLTELRPYKYVDITEYCLSDPKEKYLYIKDVKGGLTVPTLLLIYSADNNVGNFHYQWHVPSSSFSDAFKSSQVVIEDIKRSYHSSILGK